MGRRRSSLEDLTELASYLPWWVSLMLAAVTWFVLGAFGASEVTVTPENPLGAVSGAIPRAFAVIGQHVLTAAFTIGAVMSLGRSWRDGRLLRRVTRHPFDTSDRYHGQDVDPMITMSWREFEHLVSEVYRRRGYSVTETPDGADGGVDLVARTDGQVVLVQCKRWRTRNVGVSVVRELLGVVSARGATGGAIVTVGRFTDEARRFAKGTSIELIDGKTLGRQAREVDAGRAPLTGGLASRVAESTPECPKCQSPMVRQVARRAPTRGRRSWDARGIRVAGEYVPSRSTAVQATRVVFRAPVNE